jgi:hypothetical protein
MHFFTSPSSEVWYFKSARDISTGVVKIYPLSSCRRELTDYTRRSRTKGIVEARRVFTSREKAEAAYAIEKAYADATQLPPEQQRETLRALLDRLHDEYGINVRGAAELLGDTYSKLRAYSCGLRDGTPCAIVKVEYLLRRLEALRQEMGAQFSDWPATGCGRKSRRRGRPDIWKSAPSNRS